MAKILSCSYVLLIEVMLLWTKLKYKIVYTEYKNILQLNSAVQCINQFQHHPIHKKINIYHVHKQFYLLI